MKNVFIALLLCLIPIWLWPQKLENYQLAELIKKYKLDLKGPYKDIRWFCKDGTTLPPQERCPEPGVQRARYKDEVISLAETNHIFLGQILATTDYSNFWDSDNDHSRLKQYLLENYLKRADKGWILRKAQYYRGAIQAEDEENWGIDFFNWLLKEDQNIIQNFFLVREAAKIIPHQGDDNKTLLIRSISKEISDSVPSFLNIRVKIHGQPELTDIQTVKKFREENRGKIPTGQLNKLDALIQNMESVYQPANLSSLDKYLKKLPKESELRNSIQNFTNSYESKSNKDKIIGLADLIWKIRNQILSIPNSSGRLASMDISIKLEEIFFREMKSWEVINLNDLLEKTYYLGLASTGCGYLEIWEWNKIQFELQPPLNTTMTLGEINEKFEIARRMVEWGTGMARGVFKDVIELYAGFEPLALGFTDDVVRASVLLLLGDYISELGEYISKEVNLSNNVMGISGQSHIRGLNPGFAMGELVVSREITENIQVLPDKVYIFDHPPADLKPVAGIATVTEGNLVSHVQLLARNLGIPNAVVSSENLDELKKFNGEKVFYAVSNKGTVLMKPVDQMTPEEKRLFETKKRKEDKILVPADKIDLNQKHIVDLKNVQAKHSGILCGPKAANLGQLKLMFPDHVVDGLVIPFGIFKQHMDQIIPGSDISYWELLSSIFREANEMLNQGKSAEEIEKYTLDELEKLRAKIKSMPLIPEFIDDLENSFEGILGEKLGEIAVFLRSDTNMEDLKDFTGAGLNLTLFNVLEKDKILQGIKDVWASPYSERSYKWRQRFLLNPENVYPSILIIPGVNVDCSGVLITKGILANNDDDLTLAFSRGVGGAVEGQVAETYLIHPDGNNILLSPARETYYTALSNKGGTIKKMTTFEKPLLTDGNLSRIKDFAEHIRQKMKLLPEKNSGPFDIELGIKNDKIWLFQIRPFVDNKNAAGLDYLQSISPVFPFEKIISTKENL